MCQLINGPLRWVPRTAHGGGARQCKESEGRGLAAGCSRQHTHMLCGRGILLIVASTGGGLLHKATTQRQCQGGPRGLALRMHTNATDIMQMVRLGPICSFYRLKCRHSHWPGCAVFMVKFQVRNKTVWPRAREDGEAEAILTLVGVCIIRPLALLVS